MFVCVVNCVHLSRWPSADVTQAAKKETILDLEKFMDKGVRVKFNGGREGDHITM